MTIGIVCNRCSTVKMVLRSAPIMPPVMALYCSRCKFGHCDYRIDRDACIEPKEERVREPVKRMVRNKRQSKVKFSFTDEYRGADRD